MHTLFKIFVKPKVYILLTVNLYRIWWLHFLLIDLIIPQSQRISFPQSLHSRIGTVLWLEVPTTSSSSTTHWTLVVLNGVLSVLSGTNISFIHFQGRHLLSGYCVLVTVSCRRYKAKEEILTLEKLMGWFVFFPLAMLKGLKILFTLQLRGPFWTFPCG